jgi:hypothetical protein
VAHGSPYKNLGVAARPPKGGNRQPPPFFSLVFFFTFFYLFDFEGILCKYFILI